jgi:hypothetical protein
VRYGDVLAARVAVQLGWTTDHEARTALRALAQEVNPLRDWVNRFEDVGRLSDDQVETLRHRVALYEHVWLEDCYLRQLEGRCKIPKRVVVELLLALERQAYRQRVGVELTRAKKLTPKTDASLLAAAQADCANLAADALADARARDFAQVAEPLILGARLEPSDFQISTLFRSAHTQALLDKRKLVDLRVVATPAPLPAPTPAPLPDPTPAPLPDPTPAPLPDPTPAPRSGPIPDPTPAPRSSRGNLDALRRIGDYEVADTLGVGGMGAVYLCRKTGESAETYYAVKVLLQDIATQVTRGRFAREIQLTALVSHEHVIDVIDSGETAEGLSYLVVPALWGEELRETLKRADGMGLRPGLALHVFEQLLHALEACHSHKIVHRDLKPENVFVLTGGKFDVKLLDFGVAKLQDEAYDQLSSFVTANREVVGTPAYLSPDAITNDQIDGRTDLYSLGIMFFEMLTGELPITSRTPQGFLAQHLICPPASLAETCPDMDWPPALQGLLSSMMAKSRKKRPQSCAAILAQLDAGLRKEIQSLDPTAAETLPPDYHEVVEPNPGFRGLLGRLLGTG